MYNTTPFVFRLMAYAKRGAIALPFGSVSVVITNNALMHYTY